MIAFVVPPIAIIAAAILTPLAGWRIAAIHTLGMCTVAIFLIELVALTIRFVPFTRAYPPGHANLKSLWWLYVLGLFAFAYWPARIALSSIQDPTQMIEMSAALAVAIGALEIVGRRRSVQWSAQVPDELGDDPHNITVLDIGTLIQHTHADQ
jgi:hypothetical protein